MNNFANGARRRPCQAHMGYAPVMDGSVESYLSRSPQYGVFICIWRANPKITELRAGETLTGVC